MIRGRPRSALSPYTTSFRSRRTGIERTHYMGSTKLFCLVDRPFWKDVDPQTGRHRMSMTLSDRMTRGTYLLDQGEGRTGLICLSYTWADEIGRASCRERV